MAYPRFQRSRQMVKARRTAGNLTLNSTSWANVDTALDLTLEEVQVGDELVYGMSGRVLDELIYVYFDVVTIISGSPVNSFNRRGAVSAAAASDQGVQAWHAPGDVARRHNLTGTAPPYTVVSGDLTAGAVTLRLRYATSSAANRTLLAELATGGSPLDVWAMNLGPGQ